MIEAGTEETRLDAEMAGGMVSTAMAEAAGLLGGVVDAKVAVAVVVVVFSLSLRLGGKESMGEGGFAVCTAGDVGCAVVSSCLTGTDKVAMVEVEETGTEEADAEGPGAGKLGPATSGPDVAGGPGVE